MEGGEEKDEGEHLEFHAKRRGFGEHGWIGVEIEKEPSLVL